MSAHSLNSFTHSFDIGQVEGWLVLCFGERGFGMFPEGAVNHPCGIQTPEEQLDQQTTQGDPGPTQRQGNCCPPSRQRQLTVVMDQSDYTVKMGALLEDSAYRRLKYDPTTKVEARITSALKELEQKGHLSTKQRLFLTQIYVLPKVHKEGTPCDQSCLPSALPHTNCPGSLSES